MLIESFSGVRGKYPTDLNENVALVYAQAFLNILKKEHAVIVIGRDTRTSGASLQRSMMEVLPKALDVGVLSTPAIEEAVRSFKADGGIILTASHNPPEYNGFKFLDSKGGVLAAETMDKVIDEYHRLDKLDHEKFLEKFVYKRKKFPSEIRHKEALANYVDFLSTFFTRQERSQLAASGIRILLDPNGGTGVIALDILKQFGIAAKAINCELGVFKRSIEPSEAALLPLAKEIPKAKSQFAAGFDCDADRVEIMLADGVLVSGNHLLALIVDDFLSRGKREPETVVVNDATSYVVKEIAESYGARFLEVEVGETNVVRVMDEFESKIGGEGSSGGVIASPSRCRDGILTLLLLCRILSRKKKSLKELVSELPEYFYCRAALERPFDREKVKEHYLKRGFTIQETGDETGGIKALTHNGWIWMRPSKTEHNQIRLASDSKDEKLAKHLLDEAEHLL